MNWSNIRLKLSIWLIYYNIFCDPQSLCRDLEKEGMKEWLDMMLEKVAIRVADDEGPSSRDKELRNAEKKKLQALIERHDKLMPGTIETQAKVCYWVKSKICWWNNNKNSE